MAELRPAGCLRCGRVMMGLLRPELYSPKTGDIMLEVIGRAIPNWGQVKLKLDARTGMSKQAAMCSITGPGTQAALKRENWRGLLVSSCPADDVQLLLDKIDHWHETHQSDSKTGDTQTAVDTVGYLAEVLETYLAEVAFREAELIGLFKQFDTDGSGDMNFDEFSEMIAFCVGPEFDRRELMHMFNDINDSEMDDDAAISPESFAAFCHGHGIYPPSVSERKTICGADHGSHRDPFRSLHNHLSR